MNQRRDGEFWLLLHVCFERNDAIGFAFEFILARQTAETFTSATASATTAAFFLRLNRDLHL